MKSLIITLIILLPGGKTDLKDVEIFDSSCYTWYQQNVTMGEIKTTLFSRRSYHVYDGKRVIGYICNDKEPN
tara:strand:- start:373 stop:588 length:216 start_codon:yes stop_codon:yes gene_type:complete